MSLGSGSLKVRQDQAPTYAMPQVRLLSTEGNFAAVQVTNDPLTLNSSTLRGRRTS